MASARSFQGQSVGVAAQVAVDDGEVVQPGGRGGVVGSQGRLGDGQRPLLQRQRVGGPPEAVVGGGEVAQADGRFGVVGSQGRLGDGQRPLLQGQRVGGPPQVTVGDGEVAQAGRPCSGWSGPRAVSVMASARSRSGSASA